jgi:hypothetical protein
MRRVSGRIAILLAACLLSGGLLLPTAATAQDEADFDHVETRFPLTGSHRRESCESCHADGLFAGTPARCELCHDGSGLRAETARS